MGGTGVEPILLGHEPNVLTIILPTHIEYKRRSYTNNKKTEEGWIRTNVENLR